MSQAPNPTAALAQARQTLTRLSHEKTAVSTRLSMAQQTLAQCNQRARQLLGPAAASLTDDQLQPALVAEQARSQTELATVSAQTLALSQHLESQLAKVGQPQ